MAKKATSGATGKELKASMAFKGITPGTKTTFDVNGCSGTWKDKGPSDPGSYPKEDTVKSNPAMNQHKRLAMKGKT